MKFLKGAKKNSYDFFGVDKLFLLSHFLNMIKHKLVYLYIPVKLYNQYKLITQIKILWALQINDTSVMDFI